MSNKAKRLSGFTLVELIVVIALFGLIISAALGLLVPLNNLYRNTFEYSDTQAIVENVRRVAEDDLRFADRMWVCTNAAYSDEETFITQCQSAFRENFKLGTAYANRKPYANGEIFCMKIDNPEVFTNVPNADKGGRIRLWVFDENGHQDTSANREWVINQNYYNEYSMSITFPGSLTITDTGSSIRFHGKDIPLIQGQYSQPAAINPAQFNMNINIYNNQYRDRANTATSPFDICESTVSSNISLSLTNMVRAGTYSTDSIEANGTTFPPATRFTYYNDPGTQLGAHVDVTTDNTSGDIYFFYTRPQFN